MNTNNLNPNTFPNYVLGNNSGDDLDEVAFPHSQLIVKSSDDDEKLYDSEEDMDEED